MELWDKQQQICPICERRFDGRRVAVDHDHKTHEARGLLCATPCNHYLVAKNTEATARRVLAYLESPSARL
jgi:Recombination endonuclease VII